MDQDRNLLFGVLAVQLKMVTSSQLMEAAGAWATDSTKNLATRLREASYLSEKNEEILSRLVAEAVRAHDGDAGATLQTFGGQEEVYESFRGSIVVSEAGDFSVLSAPSILRERDDVESFNAVHEAPGRYTQQVEHARGGMGRVLLVYDEHLGRQIVLKELLPELSPSSGGSSRPSPVRMSVPLVARFLQEARITGQMEHPSIVPVYELGHRRDGSLYYTMKLVRGQSLAKAIKMAQTLPERLKLLPHFLDLCQAIAYAHSKKVIHRDLKPANVMVGEFGETVVIDWGLAKAKHIKDVHVDGMAETLAAINSGRNEITLGKTAYGKALGTPAYMPPEQAKGELDRIDEQSDVYSLGAVLYEVLTGRAPFEGRSLADTLNHVIAGEPPAITEIEEKVPRELAAICQRAMSKIPLDRYPSAAVLADEIQRFQSGAYVQAYDYKVTERVGKFITKHKTLLIVAAISIILSGIAAMAMTILFQLLSIDVERYRSG